MNATLLSCKSQIIFAFDELDLCPADIASQFDDYGFEEEDIKALLADHSPKYRESLKERTEAQTRGEGTKEELDILLQEYRHLSRVSDNDVVKERALKFLINEKKGRNDLAARGLALKERQVGALEVDTARRANEFIDTMKLINNKIQEALTNGVSAHKPNKNLLLEINK